MSIDECKDTPFEILLRIPDWAKGTAVSVNGENIEGVTAGEFLKIERTWKAEDHISIAMPMDVHLVEGHPRIEEVRNQVAIKRGPFVYCIETPDLPKDTSILEVYVDGNGVFTPKHHPDFLGGITTIESNLLIRSNDGNEIYRTISKPKFESYQTQFVPYFAWSNRGEAEMTVFLPVLWS